MNDLNQMTDEQLLVEIGNRLARMRLEKNLTQAELARQAGVGLATLQRLESGAVGTQLSGFLRVGRALGLLERLEAFIPEPQESPMALLKQQGKKRKRASGNPPETGDSGPWTWGDES